MKFLHTGDLHIGKRTEGRLRLDEQKDALREIADIARAENVDLALIAGDVFDVNSPSADAKRIFYRFALDLAFVCPVVAVAGNHDSAADLSAPAELAEAAEIMLLGLPKQLTFTLGGEKTNVAALPYPDEAALREFEGDFTDKVKALIGRTAAHFVRGENNILLTHLFMTGSSEDFDENTLGPARMLPKTVLPENCYSALGHIHKPSVVSRSGNAYYSGSPLNYHFDGDADKSVIIAEMTGGEVKEVRRVPLKSGRKLVTETVSDFDGAVAALERNEGNLVKIRYVSDVPLSVTETKKLKSFECFVKLEPVLSVSRTDGGTAAMKTKSDKELFRLYFENIYKSAPDDDIMTLFADVAALAKGEDK